MWPRRIEPGPSRYPARLRLAGLALAGAALLVSGLPLSLVALLGLAALALARRWRPATPARLAVSPEAVRLVLRDGRRLAVRPPFRALLREHWLALHCPGVGWVWLFPDQLDPAAVTPLRQVLFLQRR